MKLFRSITQKITIWCMLSIISGPLWAGEGDISVYIQNVAVIQSAYAGHQAGNMEVRILNGFQMPAGVNCDGTYITTLRSTDPDGKLFALLTVAQMKQKAIALHITDSPAYVAFYGRCSILGASLQ